MKALELVAQLSGLLALIQGVEFLFMRKAWSDRGVWAWPTLAKELSPLALFLNEKSFLLLNVIRLIIACGAILWPNFWSVGALLIIHVLTVVRWLGSFNGGSDYMNSLVLLFTWIGLLFPASMGAVCLWYITLQLCFSYFKAGWIKFKNRKWRRGEAIPQFVLSPIYSQDRVLAWIFKSRPLAFALSWMTIIFELLFPVALLDTRIATLFMAIGFVFHLGNAYVFGLNRFVFAWASAYPALYWCAGHSDMFLPVH